MSGEEQVVEVVLEEKVNHEQEIVRTKQPNKVETHDDYANAGMFLVELKSARKKIEEWFADPVKAAYEAHKMIVGRKNEALRPFDTAEADVKKMMNAFLRKEQEERARLAREDADRQLAAAAKLEEIGEKEMAQAVMESAQGAEAMAVKTVKPEAPKGVVVTKTWVAKIVDPKLVPAYYGDVELRDIRQGTLNKLAKELRDTVKIPGVVFEEEQSVSGRAQKNYF